MEDSILLSIKKLLGIDNSDDVFDLDILVNINSIFSTLYQIGVGEEEHYVVLGKNDTWNEVFKDCSELVDLIKLYTYLKVRVIFDPPTSSFVLDALNNQAKELEWRIQVQAESSDIFSSCDCEGDSLPDSVVESLWNEIMNS